MEKTCGNCEWLDKDEKPYYCAWLSLPGCHKVYVYHEEDDAACEDWSYGEQEAGE